MIELDDFERLKAEELHVGRIAELEERLHGVARDPRAFVNFEGNLITINNIFLDPSNGKEIARDNNGHIGQQAIKMKEKIK